MADPRILVVYYSRSGTTRKLAQAISQELHCDLEEITETRSRNGLVGYLRSIGSYRYGSNVQPTFSRCNATCAPTTW